MTEYSGVVRPKAIVIGAGGGLGHAVIAELMSTERYTVHAVSREPVNALVDHSWECDYEDDSIARIAQAISAEPGSLSRLIICNGVLHGESFRPERSIKHLNRHSMLHVLETNTVVPMLWLAAFTTAIKNADELRIAVFSARVGSLTDNGLGGWCSYRASKAALNMSLKCAAIEYARLNKNAKLIAFHPGTTDTAMSKPFQKGVPEGKLFEPSFVAHRLITLLDAMASDGELSYVDWDGKTIPW